MAIRKKRLAGIIVTLVIIGGLFGAAIIFLMRFVDGPVTAQATTLAGAKASTSPTPVPPAHLGGLYVEIEYPGTLDLLAQVKTNVNALEQYNISSKSDYRQAITVLVQPTTSGGMADDSSYRLRAMDTADYHQSSVMAGSDHAVLMTKADKSEQTLFVIHGGKMLTVSVTSTSIKASAADIMVIVQPSIRWRS